MIPRLIITFLSFVLSGCVVDAMLAVNCAVETPIKGLSPETVYFESKMNITTDLGSFEESALTQCNIVDYSCHAGEMGLDEVWETIPLGRTTLSAPTKSGQFLVDIPNCGGLENSNHSRLNGVQSYSYWSNPRIATESGEENIQIWYEEHREQLQDYGISSLIFTVTETEHEGT